MQNSDMQVSEKISDKEESQNNQEEIQDLMELTESWFDYFNDSITRARNYLTFLYVDQWDIGIRQAREALGKPTLQMNKIISILRSIEGEQRNNTPALDVRNISKKDHVSDEHIELYNGLIREISYYSNADEIYQNTFKQMLEIGWGANARVVLEYDGKDTTNQRICIKPIVDFQVVFFDPEAQESNKSDGDVCGVYTIMSKDKYDRIYPDHPNPQSLMPNGTGYYLPWSTEESVIICEIYRKIYFKKTIVVLSNNKSLPEEEAQEFLDLQDKILQDSQMTDIMGYEKVEILRKEKVEDYKIKHTKFTQNAILEEIDYPGKILPIPYAEGDSTIIDGQRIPISFIQDQIDIQKMINYVKSEIAYGILRSRKETILATPSNTRGFEHIYRNPDQVQGALPYNPDDITREKPQFITPPAFSAELLQVDQGLVNDLQQISGRYEESRGEQSNAVSKLAIAERKSSSSNGINVFTDNLARYIKQIGRIILDLIPHVYDTERTITIRTKNGETKNVLINKKSGYRFLSENDEEPEFMRENDMTKGEFDIEVRVDGSFDAQKQAALNFLLQLSASNPAIANLIPDLLAENSGLENADKLIERLRTLVPPDILAKEEGKPMPQQQPPQPNPEFIVQTGKIALENRLADIKEKQLMLDEQKLMQEAQLAGLTHQATLSKAAAEIKKANIEKESTINKSQSEKDIAILNHANTIHTNLHATRSNK